MADRIERYRRCFDFPSLIEGGTVTPHWLADGHRFWYADGHPSGAGSYLVDPIANTREPLLDPDRLRASLRSALGPAPPKQDRPIHDLALVDGERAVRFKLGDRDFICDRETYVVTELPRQSAAEADRRRARRIRGGFYSGAPDVYEIPSPDGQWFALDQEHNLALRSPADGRIVPLTADGDRAHGWDVEHACWSPDSLRLAVRKLDNRGVAEVPIVHWLKPAEEVEWVYHARPGGRLTRTELYVVDIAARRPVPVVSDSDPEGELAIVGWRPDGSELIFARVDRFHRRFDLIAADPTTGATRPILTETAETFISFPWFGPVGVTLLADGQRFSRMSERDGWRHLYLHDLDGRLLRRLSAGTFPVVEVVAVDEAGGWVFFTAHAEPHPYDTHLYRVSLDGGPIERLTEGSGHHEIRFAPAMSCFLDTHSSPDRPPTVELRAADGRLLRVLSEADIGRLRGLGWQPPEEFVVKAADGETDLYGVIHKRPDFNPERRYPVVECIYGGPQETRVPRTFFDRWGMDASALAQLGFVVFIVDGRGTPERGKAFHDVVYRNFGRHEIPDHVTALRQVAAERPYMDPSRVGVIGRSWGGNFTIRALLLAPDVYHVGIATNPDVDPRYDGTAVEPFLGPLADNLAGYDYASNTRLAGELRGKLLLVHGTSDLNVPFRETVRMAEALVQAGKPFDLLILPEQRHALTGTGETYWRDAVARYLVEHLRPDGDPGPDGR